MNSLQFKGKQLEQKKVQKVDQLLKQNTFKPEIGQSSELLAKERKKKIALQLGIDPEEVEQNHIDQFELLRAQGQLIKMSKEAKAQNEIQAKLAKECTFKPEIMKKSVIKTSKPEDNGRASTGSINLSGIAKKRQEPFANASGNASKYDQLYSLRKRQMDKTDKSKEDYEFERHGAECTFAPQLNNNPQYMRQNIKNQETAAHSQTSQGTASLSAKERQEKFEQKRLERLRRGREEKARKAEMMERGIPKSKPMSQAQVMEKENARKMLFEHKLSRSRISNSDTNNMLKAKVTPKTSKSQMKAPLPKQAEKMPLQQPVEEEKLPEEEAGEYEYVDETGPMSLTINHQFEGDPSMQENDDFLN